MLTMQTFIYCTFTKKIKFLVTERISELIFLLVDTIRWDYPEKDLSIPNIFIPEIIASLTLSIENF